MRKGILFASNASLRKVLNATIVALLSCFSGSGVAAVAEKEEKSEDAAIGVERWFPLRASSRDRYHDYKYSRRHLLLRSVDSEFQLVDENEKKKTLVPLFARAREHIRRYREKHTAAIEEKDQSLERLEEKERAYVNAMEQFRTRALDRKRLTEFGKEYEEEAEKFEKEEEKRKSDGSRDGSSVDEKTTSSSSSSSSSSSEGGLTVFFGVAGGESNCEFVLDKGRWIADRLNAKKMVIPTCDHLFHSDADVDLLDYMVPDTLNHCKKEESSNTFEVASWDHNVNAHGLSIAERFFGTSDRNNNGENVEESTEKESNPSHHQQLVATAEDASQKKILCVQFGDGKCDREGKQFTPKLEFDSVITQDQLNKDEIEQKGYEYVYFAGVFDWRPHDEKFKEWPGLFKSCDPPRLKEKIFNEARESIKKYNADHPVDPEKTLCAHWRQEDFVGKGDPFVVDPVEGAKRMFEKAEKHGNLTDVLIITNDPKSEEDKERLEKLKSELSARGLTPHTVHHDGEKHTHDIFVDKAACLLMKGFIGTRASSFSQSIATMHGVRETYI